jgi:hypothetical protein
MLRVCQQLRSRRSDLNLNYHISRQSTSVSVTLSLSSYLHNGLQLVLLSEARSTLLSRSMASNVFVKLQRLPQQRNSESNRKSKTILHWKRMCSPRWIRILLEYCWFDYWTLAQKASDDWSREAFTLTTRILQINPEYYTVWNYRRNILLHGIFPGRWDDKINVGLYSTCRQLTRRNQRLIDGRSVYDDGRPQDASQGLLHLEPSQMVPRERAGWSWQ